MHIDAISKFIFSNLKESMNGIQEVESKEAFEELARNNDVHINHYQCLMVSINQNCSPHTSSASRVSLKFPMA
jgi:hypothetical protein